MDDLSAVERVRFALGGLIRVESKTVKSVLADDLYRGHSFGPIGLLPHPGSMIVVGASGNAVI